MSVEEIWTQFLLATIQPAHGSGKDQQIMTEDQLAAHWQRTNAENSRWSRLEMSRRQTARLRAAIDADLQKLPTRHSVASFTTYSAILTTLAVYEAELERLKDNVPADHEWITQLVTVLGAAMTQRRELFGLIPELRAFDVAKQTPANSDEWTLLLLSEAIDQFRHSAYAFLEESEDATA
jgi:hypothetical protein